MNSAGVLLATAYSLQAASTPVAWMGGQGLFAVAGTFGGATVSLEYLLPDSATWVAAGAATTLTAPGGGLFTLPACPVRINVTVAVPTNLVAAASRIPV